MIKSNASKCSSKYERFFTLLSQVGTSSKGEAAIYKKLIAELLNVYIQNNDSFPSIFYINGNYPEEVVVSTINTLCGHEVQWVTKSAPPRPNKNYTCVKMAG